MSAQVAAPPWVVNPSTFTNKTIRDLCTDAGLDHPSVWRQWREAVAVDTRTRIARGEVVDRTGAGAVEIATRSQAREPRAKTVGPPRLVPSVVPRLVAGRGGVAHEVLRDALGERSYRLWCALLKLRGDRTGLTSATIENLMFIVRRPRRCVERSLARLRAAGLVLTRAGDLRTTMGFTPTGDRVWRTKPKRTVLGALPAPTSVDDVCPVPTDTERWVADLPKRGRPVTSGVWAAKGRTARRKVAAERTTSERWRVEVRNLSKGGEGSNGAEGVKQVAGRCETGGGSGCEIPGVPTDQILSLSSSLPNHGSSNQSTGSNLISESGYPDPTSPDGGPMPTSTPTPPPKVTPHPFFATPEARTLLSRPRPVDDFARHPVAHGAPHDAIPRLPTGGALAVVIPSAPMVDPAAEDCRKVHMLRRAFEGAVESNRKLGLRGPCYTFRGVHETKGRRRMNTPIDPTHPQFAVLFEAADLLIEHGIAFASWCAFVIEQVWIEKMNGRGAPPLAVVFSSRSINQWRGWFASGLASQGTTRNVYPYASREFMQRHDAMRADLRTIPITATVADLHAHVARYFPDGFEVELERLQVELDGYREEVRSRVAQGKWCWSDDSNIVDGRWVW